MYNNVVKDNGKAKICFENLEQNQYTVCQAYILYVNPRFKISV